VYKLKVKEWESFKESELKELKKCEQEFYNQNFGYISYKA